MSEPITTGQVLAMVLIVAVIAFMGLYLGGKALLDAASERATYRAIEQSVLKNVSDIAIVDRSVTTRIDAALNQRMREHERLYPEFLLNFEKRFAEMRARELEARQVMERDMLARGGESERQLRITIDGVQARCLQAAAELAKTVQRHDEELREKVVAPAAKPAEFVAVPSAVPEDPEARIRHTLSEESIEKLQVQLLKDAQEAGMSMTPTTARLHAISMLNDIIPEQ